MEVCAAFDTAQSGLRPDMPLLLGRAHALARRAGSLQKLDELWADPGVRRRLISGCFPHGATARLLRLAAQADPAMQRQEYLLARRELEQTCQAARPRLSAVSALLVCSNRDQTEEPIYDFLDARAPCVRPEASLQLAAQVVGGCFAAQFLCLAYARGIAPDSELGTILTNARKEYDLLERVVQITYPVYQRYYTGVTGCEQLTREEYGVMLFFWYRDSFEAPLTQLAAQISPGPRPEKAGEDLPAWLLDQMRQAVQQRHREFLEMDDDQLRRCLLALLCSRTRRPDLGRTCGALAAFDTLTARLREGAFVQRMDEERTRLLEGDFSEANRTYATAHSLDQVEDGLQFEDFLARLFTALGYRVTPTRATGDHGVDLILVKGATRTALQAKFYTGGVGNKAVQEVYSGMSIWGAAQAVVVASSTFTPQARQDARRLGVTLVDGRQLRELTALAGTAAGFAHKF